MKGVILAGGFGSRLAPFTTTITNKHLAPVYTTDGAIPMIDMPLQTYIEAGIKEVLIISSEEHCGHIMKHLGNGYKRGIDITYKIQDMNDPDNPPGIASALKLCQGYTGNAPFVVILGDNFYEHNESMFSDLDVFRYSRSKCHLFLSDVKDPERFGVADIRDGNIVDIIEKPSNPPSTFAVTGMYCYTPDVYRIISTLTPSNRGELEITDINRQYCKDDDCSWSVLNTYWKDMGTPESMIEVQQFLKHDK